MRIAVIQGMLLVGFSAKDAKRTKDFFATVEANLRIACCQEEHLGRVMSDIFSAPHGLLQNDCSWCEAVEPVPRTVIFSGMVQKEMLGIAEFWHLSGRIFWQILHPDGNLVVSKSTNGTSS